jgi:hypothetical protein
MVHCLPQSAKKSRKQHGVRSSLKISILHNLDSIGQKLNLGNVPNHQNHKYNTFLHTQVGSLLTSPVNNKCISFVQREVGEPYTDRELRSGTAGSSSPNQRKRGQKIQRKNKKIQKQLVFENFQKQQNEIAKQRIHYTYRTRVK